MGLRRLEKVTITADPGSLFEKSLDAQRSVLHVGFRQESHLHLARKLQFGTALGLLHGAYPCFLVRLSAAQCHRNQRAESHEDTHVLRAELGAIQRIHGLHDTAA
jgi:hypothetical protein